MNDEFALKWILDHCPFYIEYIESCYNSIPESDFFHLYLVPSENGSVGSISEDLLLKQLFPQIADEFLVLETGREISDPAEGIPIAFSTADCKWKPMLVRGNEFPIVEMFKFINTHAPDDLHFLAKNAEVVVIFSHHAIFQIIGEKKCVRLFRNALFENGAIMHPEDPRRFQVEFKSGAPLDP